MYDEFLCLKISKSMTHAEKDQATRRFLRKAATHALNALQETREDFMNKYLVQYHQQVNEQQELKAQRAVLLSGGGEHPSDLMRGTAPVDQAPVERTPEQLACEQREADRLANTSSNPIS